jgi:chemotaxis signal transduction protein
MSTVNKPEILLESGTHEMEIIEFHVGSQPLGINVQKLKEIISFDESALTAIPESDSAMLGTLLLRGATIPLINPPMEVKCDSVGADGYADKPEIAKFIEMMDSFIEIGHEMATLRV